MVCFYKDRIISIFRTTKYGQGLNGHKCKFAQREYKFSYLQNIRTHVNQILNKNFSMSAGLFFSFVIGYFALLLLLPGTLPAILTMIHFLLETETATGCW